jgi:hypothetical protein
MTGTGTAVITKDTEWSVRTLSELRRWRIDLPWGGRRFTSSRKAAIEWCDEHDVPYELA